MTVPSERQDQWRTLFREVSRELFIPDDIWLYDDAADRLVAVHRNTEPDRWRSTVAADRLIVTQVNLGEPPHDAATHLWPSSSCSMPSIVLDMLDALDARPGQAVLEIGTGTGWNAALLCRRVGAHGRVSTVEVDTGIAAAARERLAHNGFHATVITGDGLDGHQDGAPFDRIICTAAIRDTVPPAWLAQLGTGGRLVTPWGTDYFDGCLLSMTASAPGTATGRFSGDLAFMRIRSQRAALYDWEPEPQELAAAEWRATNRSGSDFHNLITPDEARFAIGARVSNCYLHIAGHRYGTMHHSIELDDATTRSWAELAVNLNSKTEHYQVRHLGPRNLWHEVDAAYDWWHANDRPTMTRFGLTVHNGHQQLWLDTPQITVRNLTPGR